jgi:DNA-binding CsgD family transcriptional regulator
MHARSNLDRRRNEVAGGWAKEALAMAAGLGLVDLVADARTVLARLSERAGDPSASLAALESAVLSARSAGELTAELRSLFSVGDLHYQQARWEHASEAYRAAMECAREAGHQWAPYGIDARVMASLVAYHRGEWDVADRLTDTSSETPPPLAWALLTAAGLGPPAGRGGHEALSRLPELRRHWGSEGMIAILAGGAAIDLYGDAGDLRAALAVHDEVVSMVGALWDNKQFQAQVRLSALALAQLAAAAAGTPVRERAALVDQGQAYRDTAAGVAAHALTTRHRLGLEIQAWQARVDAEHARLRWLTGAEPPTEDELVSSRERDVSAFQRLGHVFEVARSKARLAAVLRAVGRPDEAAELAQEATQVATRLGATPLLAELEATPPRRSRSRADEPTRVLTDRELEVLTLVAQGRTNREIAQRLFISTKTASVHVSHILAKLGAGGRTEAVAVARSRSLLPAFDPR